MSDVNDQLRDQAASHAEREQLNTLVRVEAVWRGQKYGHFIQLAPEQATHYAMDKAVWDATVEVRRSLVRQEYPHLTNENNRRVEFRNEFEAFGAIRSHCSQTGDRFELVPPTEGTTDKWRAYFKKRPWATDAQFLPGPGAIESNPAVGLGSTDYIAIENLLRFVEGRETIDG